MKKLGILILLTFLVGFVADWQPLQAQCNPTSTTTVAGVYPDPLPAACVGTLYSQIADFVFPDDTTITNPFPLTIPFDSFEVFSVTNVPAGITFTLNSPNGKYYPVMGGNARGCADITGTPTTANLVTDSIEISFRGWLTVPILGGTSAVSLVKQRLAVFATPTAGFTAGAPTGNTVAFTDNSSGSNGWIYNFGDGNSSTGQNPTHTYAGPGTYQVCQIVDNGNCQDTTCSTVTIGCPAPLVVWSSNVNGLSSDFSDLTLGASTSWFWDFGDGNTSTTQNPNHIYGAAGNYIVCLTVMNACGTDSTCMSVTTCDLPVSGFSSTATGVDADFVNASTNATTYAWDFGDGGSSTLADPSHTYAATGTYTVCLIATSTCGSDTTCMPVSVCATPQSDFTFANASGTVTFSDQSVINGSATYEWLFGDGGTSTMQNPVYAYTAAGMYTACLTITDSCGTDSSCQVVDITVAGLEKDLLQNLHLYPNPNTGSFTLQGSLTEGSDIAVSVVDILGKEVFEQSAGRIQGPFRQEIELGQLEPGLYFVRVKATSDIVVMKMVIERQ